GTPALLSPEALGAPGPVSPAPGAPTPAPVVAPIVPAPSAPAEPAAPQPQAQIMLSAPAAGPDGALISGGGPHTVPIQITGVTDLATLSLTITYDPSVVKEATVTPGSFMAQGGAASSFAPRIDASAGR